MLSNDALNFIEKMLAPTDPRRSEFGYCYGVEDGLDGYCIHAEGCRDAGRSWTGPNSTCTRKRTEPFYGGI